MIINSGIFLIALVMSAHTLAEEPVRTELARQQQQTGLSLTSFYRNLATLKFADRSHETRSIQVTNGTPSYGAISRDGQDIALQLSARQPFRQYLGIVHSDGTGLAEYPSIDTPEYLCWCYDKSRLVAEASDKRKASYPHRQLLVVNLKSDATDELLNDDRAYVTSQCWSPDDSQIIYGLQGMIWIYDLKENKGRALAKGQEPTWSPDGNWIGFVDHDSYYIIRPNGGERKLLFKSNGTTRSGLWWSPDSRIVAYISLTEHSYDRTDFVARRVHVRRLADNSDDWISEGADVGYAPSFQWIQPNKKLATE